MTVPSLPWTYDEESLQRILFLVEEHIKTLEKYQKQPYRSKTASIVISKMTRGQDEKVAARSLKHRPIAAPILALK